MTPNAEPPRREYTEAELKAYRAEMGRKMTAAEFVESLDGDRPRVSDEELMRELEREFPGHFAGEVAL